MVVWELQSSAVICKQRQCRGFGSSSHLQLSGDIDSVVVLGAAVIRNNLQASTVRLFLGLQSPAVIWRHRQCGRFGSCNHLQSFTGIESAMVFELQSLAVICTHRQCVGFGTCSHLQSSASIGSVVVLGAAVICSHLQASTVWWFWEVQSSTVWWFCELAITCSHLQASTV